MYMCFVIYITGVQFVKISKGNKQINRQSASFAILKRPKPSNSKRPVPRSRNPLSSTPNQNLVSLLSLVSKRRRISLHVVFRLQDGVNQYTSPKEGGIQCPIPP